MGMTVRPLRPSSKPRLCTLPSPVCVPCCCSSHVASLRTFLKTSRFHYSNKNNALGPNTHLHERPPPCAKCLKHFERQSNRPCTCDHNHSPATSPGRRITSGPCIAEACACCSVSPHPSATHVSLPHHMRLQPTVTYHHSFPSKGDDCSPIAATFKTASFHVVHSSMCALLLQLPFGQPAHLPQNQWCSLQ